MKKGMVERGDETSELPDASFQSIHSFLIADVRGYTVFTQERGDEAAAELVQRFEELCVEVVDSHGGSVLEVRGDEVLAVFRSPRQAIRSAVELQVRFLKESQAHPEVPLPVGIGLDVGEAVAVKDGYRGGALNLAARLCAEAAPGEIFGTEALVHLARKVEGISFVDRGELRLKGLAEPIRVQAIVSDRIDLAKEIAPLVPKMVTRRQHGGRLQFRVLGPLEVDAGHGPIPLGGPKQRSLLATLTLRANEVVSVDTLAEEIWGDDPPVTGKNTIQTYVSQLRKAIGHDRIEARPPGYRLRLDPSELDSARFERLLADARRTRATAPSTAATMLDEALELWRGSALSDIADGSLLSEIARFTELRLTATEDLIDDLLSIGEHARVIGQLEAFLGREPLRERSWGQLMLALYRDGRQADALAAYQRARGILANELGIDPSPDLNRLHERILRQDPELEARGEPLRGYRLLEKIDDGPAGAVFRAIQPHVGRDVVVKIINETIASDPAFIRRFEQEARAVASLEHPFVVPIYDYWREPAGAYIVSRYLRGGNLRAFEEQGSIDPNDAARTLEQVASALAFAHRQGVAHGAVRPSNVLFDTEGNSYLGDFRIGAGSLPDIEEDLRDLVRLARGLLGAKMPTQLASLIEHAEGRGVGPPAEDVAKAARSMDPVSPTRDAAGDERNPFKGLRAFTEADAADFFGRRALIGRLLDRLNESGFGSRFIALVGPSGSGKSSAVRAALVPAIRKGAIGGSGDRLVAEMFPGQHPIDELESSLLRIAVGPSVRLRERLESGPRGLIEAVEAAVPDGADVVLVVDQLEEVFTQTGDEREREVFLESLRVAALDPESRVRVLVTLRADFYDRPLAYRRFGELLGARTEPVPPLTPDELEQAIRAPAEAVDLHPEPGLVAEMIADSADQPGALPLVQYALTELFERREDGRLTLAAYRDIGGVAGALSVRADRLFESSDAEGRQAIKQLFLRLVTLGEGRQDTRRRVPRHELDSLEVDQDSMAAAIDVYGRHRFLTFDREQATREPTAEIAHEALLGAWIRLRRWIDEAREDLRQDRALAAAAAEWRAADRDPGFLLQGTRLDQFDAWSGRTDLSIATSERELLRASLERREEVRAEELERRSKEERLERRSIRRLRSLVALGVASALVASILTTVAVNQRGRAEDEARVATARELAAAAVANVEADPERSILLAMEAVELTRAVDGTVLPEAEEALHRAVGASRVVLTVPGVGGSLDWSPRGVFATEGPEKSGLIDIRDAETGKSAVHPFRGHDGDVTEVGFSADGSMLATTGDDGALKVWDPATGQELMAWSGSGEVRGPSFSADGALLAAAWTDEGVVRTLDPSTEQVVSTIRDVTEVNDTALSPDGARIVVSTETGQVLLLERSKSPGRGRVLQDGFRVNAIAWSPDGRHIAAVSQNGSGDVYDAETGRIRFSLPAGQALSVAWDPAHRSRLVTGGSDGEATVWMIGGERGFEEMLSLSSQETRTGIVGISFSPRGDAVMAGNADLTAVKAWDLDFGAGAERAATLHVTGNYSDVGFGSDPRRLLMMHGPTEETTVLDLETQRVIRTIGQPVASFAQWISQPYFDVSPEGDAVAMTSGDGTASAWNAGTGEELFTVRDRDVVQVDWSPDGSLVVLATRDGSAAIVDRSGREIQLLEESPGAIVWDARFSPDGRRVATTVVWGTDPDPRDRVTIWDWERAAVVETIQTTTDWMTFHPGGTRIATVPFSRGSAEIWDVRSGRRTATLTGQAGQVYDVTFSPDGSRVATTGSDGTVRLFDPRTGAQVLVLSGHGGPIGNLEFSPDGKWLASGGAGEVRVWAIDIDELLRIARQNVTRPLTDEECDQYLHVDHCPDASAA